MNLFTDILLLLLLTISQVNLAPEVNNNKLANSSQNDLTRDRRTLFFFKKRKPGPIETVLRLMIDQWRDTKNTVNKVTSTINAQFIDESQVKPQRQLEENATTTEGPYRITRNELYRIIRRNVKGIQRLLKIELQDALSQPKPSYKSLHKSTTRNTKT